jgi:TonB family protein
MRRSSLAIALLLGCVTPTSAQVREWPSNDGWDIIQLDKSCTIDTSYSFDGRADVKLMLFWNGERAGLFLTSRDWSNRSGVEYEVTYRLGETVYSGKAEGYVDVLDKGFSSVFGAEFLDDFSRASTLLVTTGDSVITHLNLRGSAAAIATLKRCAAEAARANAAQAERVERWSYIDRDPFAVEPAEDSSRPSGEFVIVNPSWARSVAPEFPERAISRGIRSGRVQLRCVSTPNGSLADCTVVSEDPAGAGFGQAALAAARRARLSPRTVDNAAPGSTVQFPVRFEAPE